MSSRKVQTGQCGRKGIEKEKKGEIEWRARGGGKNLIEDTELISTSKGRCKSARPRRGGEKQ